MKATTRRTAAKNLHIPAPAHSRVRKAPLPEQQAKPADEDPDAPRRIATLLANPSYKEGDQDIDFLNRGDTRGVRLQLDYLYAEFLLQQPRSKVLSSFAAARESANPLRPGGRRADSVRRWLRTRRWRAA
jgi:hypothetical protein